jgi:hypothetical protein
MFDTFNSNIYSPSSFLAVFPFCLKVLCNIAWEEDLDNLTGIISVAVWGDDEVRILSPTWYCLIVFMWWRLQFCSPQIVRWSIQDYNIPDLAHITFIHWITTNISNCPPCHLSTKSVKSTEPDLLIDSWGQSCQSGSDPQKVKRAAVVADLNWSKPSHTICILQELNCAALICEV